jgi:hypothetical protein
MLVENMSLKVDFPPETQFQNGEGAAKQSVLKKKKR